MTEEAEEVCKKSLEPDMVINLSRALRPVMADARRPSLVDRILYERDFMPSTYNFYYHAACPDIEPDVGDMPISLLNCPSPNGKT
jgi:hypothetical protein